MLSMMGGCLSGFWSKEERRSVTLLTVGLDNAGKTSTIKVVSGENPEGAAPSLGFSTQEYKLGRYDITSIDLGGGKGIRGTWHHYYAEAYGSVFVVDASDRARFEEARTVLEEFLGDPRISGKPILVLANKQDVEGAADENDVCSVLYLEQMVNKYRCPCKIEVSSTTAGYGKKMDPNISSGFRWLLDQIGKDFTRLNSRVEGDVEEQKEKAEKEKRERRERVARIREERRRKEEEEARREGRTIENSDEEEEGDFKGNPFKSMDRVRDDLAKRDQEKKERKLREAAEQEENGEKKKKKKKKKKTKEPDNEQLERLEGKERSEEDTTTNNHSSSHSDASPQQSSRKDDEDEGIEITPSNSDLGQLKTDESKEGKKEKKKKKRRKMKKNNRVAPGEQEEPDQNDTPFPSPRGARAILPPIGPSWSTPPGERGMMGSRASKKPALEPLTEPSNEGVAKWSLAEDIEETPPVSVRPFRPNSDDADIIT